MCIVCTHTNTSDNKCPVCVFQRFCCPKPVQQCWGTASVRRVVLLIVWIESRRRRYFICLFGPNLVVKCKKPPDPLWYFDRFWYLSISVPGSRAIFHHSSHPAIEASAAAWQLLPTKRGPTKASPRVPRNGIKPQGGTWCWPAPVALGDPCFYQAARMCECNKIKWSFFFCWYDSYTQRENNAENIH